MIVPETSQTRTKQTHISESNLEWVLAERLGDIEPGLSLVKRQMNIPVGGIDQFCQDQAGDFVVVKSKRFGVSVDGVVGQIARYIGYVGNHIVGLGQKVRGVIVVARKDLKLEYAAKAIPNLDVKTFKLSIELTISRCSRHQQDTVCLLHSKSP